MVQRCAPARARSRPVVAAHSHADFTIDSSEEDCGPHPNSVAARDGPSVAGREVVEGDHIVTERCERLCGMASDVARTAGDKYTHNSPPSAPDAWRPYPKKKGRRVIRPGKAARGFYDCRGCCPLVLDVEPLQGEDMGRRPVGDVGAWARVTSAALSDEHRDYDVRRLSRGRGLVDRSQLRPRSDGLSANPRTWALVQCSEAGLRRPERETTQ